MHNVFFIKLFAQGNQGFPLTLPKMKGGGWFPSDPSYNEKRGVGGNVVPPI